MRESFDRLKGEWSFLQNTWKNTRQYWHDSVAERFEQKFWSQWEREVPQTLARMQELDEVLRQIKAETSD
ncbi:hypothetical protein [Dethiobacter alkaliphilus]|uniref:hypothetical protein n=1 Tax=Dethiobacter alkaliphilus TaxID=427926 RepID=UPI0022260F94|nr:hypothetical protein [Dethiobacter alkaliphilus]MCW3488670.1 hypothetical protein [Dethiobacter alkaliphilus]